MNKVAIILPVVQAISLILLYFLYISIYRIFFHPLKDFPGPKLWAVTRLPLTYHRVRGTLHLAVARFHDKYGPVMRIEPNELSFISPGAWDDIYGFCKGTKTKNFPRDMKVRLSRNDEVVNIISANEEDHRRMRKLQAHAFSDKALTSQEPILQDYVNQFVEGLKKQVEKGDGSVGLGTWFNLTTFDVIGDLAFGESFNCVKTGNVHPFVEYIFNLLTLGTIAGESRLYPILGTLASLTVIRDLRSSSVGCRAIAAEKVARRMSTETDRPDFMSYILKHNDTEKGMTLPEIKENAFILILAGSETTASSLTGIVYYLLRNRHILEKLTNEIRTNFSTQHDMTIHRLAEQEYLNAVVAEGLRMFPAAASSIQRVVPPEGALICDRFVPGGTSVGVPIWAANRSASNFASPDTFIPSRWMNDPTYANDKFHARQPFSFGPANCIGKNLAYAEMRLLLANLLWHFDLQLVEKEGEKDWIDRARVFTVWVKDELMVRLTVRR